jgi:hypothetical protein
MDITTGSDQPVPSRSVMLTILAFIAHLTMRLARLPRIEGIRVLMCVPGPEPYLAKVGIALKLLFDTEADAMARGRDAWFVISIRDLPPKTPFADPRTSSPGPRRYVRVWSLLMLAGTLAKSSVRHYLILKPHRAHPHTERDRIARRRARQFGSFHFSGGTPAARVA